MSSINSTKKIETTPTPSVEKQSPSIQNISSSKSCFTPTKAIFVASLISGLVVFTFGLLGYLSTHGALLPQFFSSYGVNQPLIFALMGIGVGIPFLFGLILLVKKSLQSRKQESTYINFRESSKLVSYQQKWEEIAAIPDISDRENALFEFIQVKMDAVHFQNRSKNQLLLQIILIATIARENNVNLNQISPEEFGSQFEAQIQAKTPSFEKFSKIDTQEELLKALSADIAYPIEIYEMRELSKGVANQPLKHIDVQGNLIPQHTYGKENGEVPIRILQYQAPTDTFTGLYLLIPRDEEGDLSTIRMPIKKSDSTSKTPFKKLSSSTEILTLLDPQALDIETNLPQNIASIPEAKRSCAHGIEVPKELLKLEAQVLYCRKEIIKKHTELLQKGEDPYSNEEVTTLINTCMHLSYLLCCKMFADFDRAREVLLKEKNIPRSREDLIIDQQSYHWILFYALIDIYAFVRRSTLYNQKRAGLDTSSAEYFDLVDQEDYKIKNSSQANELSKKFYQNGTVQFRWRALYNHHIQLFNLLIDKVKIKEPTRYLLQEDTESSYEKGVNFNLDGDKL